MTEATYDPDQLISFEDALNYLGIPDFVLERDIEQHNLTVVLVDNVRMLLWSEVSQMPRLVQVPVSRKPSKGRTRSTSYEETCESFLNAVNKAIKTRQKKDK